MMEELNDYEDEINNYNFYRLCFCFKSDDCERELVKIDNRRLIKIFIGQDEIVTYSMLLRVVDIKMIDSIYLISIVDELTNIEHELKLNSMDVLIFQNSNYIDKDKKFRTHYS